MWSLVAKALLPVLLLFGVALDFAVHMRAGQWAAEAGTEAASVLLTDGSTRPVLYVAEPPDLGGVSVLDAPWSLLLTLAALFAVAISIFSRRPSSSAHGGGEVVAIENLRADAQRRKLAAAPAFSASELDEYDVDVLDELYGKVLDALDSWRGMNASGARSAAEALEVRHKAIADLLDLLHHVTLNRTWLTRLLPDTWDLEEVVGDAALAAAERRENRGPHALVPRLVRLRDTVQRRLHEKLELEAAA